jgi:hypothetical protein
VHRRVATRVPIFKTAAGRRMLRQEASMPFSTVPAGPKFVLYAVVVTTMWFILNAGFCFSQGRG